MEGQGGHTEEVTVKLKTSRGSACQFTGERFTLHRGHKVLALRQEGTGDFKEQKGREARE